MNHEALYGTWKLVRYARVDTATGEKRDVFGCRPAGFLTYGRDGRMTAILAKEGRPRPADMSKVNERERAELFDSFGAYAGTFALEGETIIHHVEISWNECWTGTEQVRNVRLEGNRLYITTNPAPSGIDGRPGVSELEWERIERA